MNCGQQAQSPRGLDWLHSAAPICTTLPPDFLYRNHLNKSMTVLVLESGGSGKQVRKSKKESPCWVQGRRERCRAQQPRSCHRPRPPAPRRLRARPALPGRPCSGRHRPPQLQQPRPLPPAPHLLQVRLLQSLLWRLTRILDAMFCRGGGM